MEDEELSSYGSLPDQSSRTWRHPSEIAAELAGTGQPNSTTGSAGTPAGIIDLRNTGPWRPTGHKTTIGAAALIACLGGLALASIAKDSRLATTGSQSDNALVGAGAAVEVPPVGLLDRSSPGDISGAGIRTSASPSVATTQPSLTLANRPTTSDAPLTSTTSMAGTPPGGSALVDGRQSVQGVLPLFASPNQMPIANGVSIDGLILTSASSLGGFEQVHTPSESGWITLNLIAADLHTDVAVLEQAGPPVPLSPVVTAVGGPTAEPGQLVAILGGHQQPLPSAAEESGNGYAASIGEVVATGKRTTTRDGYEILDTLLTTCRTDDLSGGAALIDFDGHVVGLVVSSQDKLAAALPLDTAIEIGWSLMLDGWRGGGWLGVHGRTSENGVQLLTIDQDGPAHRAGLRNNDLMTSIDGQPLSDVAHLLDLLRRLEPGDTVQVQVIRPLPDATVGTGQAQTASSEQLLFDVILSDRAAS